MANLSHVLCYEDGNLVLNCTNKECAGVSDLTSLLLNVPKEAKSRLLTALSESTLVNDGRDNESDEDSDDSQESAFRQLKESVNNLSKVKVAELHSHLSAMLLSSGMSAVAYRGEVVPLISAASNVSTSDLFRVLEHRAFIGKDKEARGIILTLMDAPLRSKPGIVRDVYTKLVFVERGVEGRQEHQEWDRSYVWEVCDDALTADQRKGFMLNLDTMISIIADTKNHPAYYGESASDRCVRVFCTWATEIVRGKWKNAYPMKFHTDALLIDRFIYEYYCIYREQRMTDAQVRRLNDTVINEYKKKEVLYGWVSELSVRRYVVDFPQPNRMGVRRFLNE